MWSMTYCSWSQAWSNYSIHRTGQWSHFFHMTADRFVHMIGHVFVHMIGYVFFQRICHVFLHRIVHDYSRFSGHLMVHIIGHVFVHMNDHVFHNSYLITSHVAVHVLVRILGHVFFHRIVHEFTMIRIWILFRQPFLSLLPIMFIIKTLLSNFYTCDTSTCFEKLKAKTFNHG